MKDYIVLAVIGLGGFLLAFSEAEKTIIIALVPALVSAYSTIRITQIKAEVEKRALTPPARKDTLLDVLLGPMLITVLVALIVLVGVVLVSLLVGPVLVG